MDDEFLHNIVKVAVDPRGDSNAMTKFIVNNKTDAGKTDNNLFFMTTNCQIVRSRLLTHLINYINSCVCPHFDHKKLANERASSAVIVKISSVCAL